LVDWDRCADASGGDYGFYGSGLAEPTALRSMNKRNSLIRF